MLRCIDTRDAIHKQCDETYWSVVFQCKREIFAPGYLPTTPKLCEPFSNYPRRSPYKTRRSYSIEIHLMIKRINSLKHIGRFVELRGEQGQQGEFSELNFI